MADEMCDEAYRRESDDTQGILWPFCHHSENEANTLDRIELGEEKRKSYTQDSRPKISPSGTDTYLSMNYFTSLLKPVSVGICIT